MKPAYNPASFIFVCSLFLLISPHCQHLMGHADVLSLDRLVLSGKKDRGLNSGSIYKDKENDTIWFVKQPTASAHVSHEYIVGQLLALLDPNAFAEIRLVQGDATRVASRLLSSFKSYKDYRVDYLSDLVNQAEKPVHAIEFLMVASCWVGLEDENKGNIGTISGDNDTLRLTRIDYDTAFHFENFDDTTIQFRKNGVNFFDEAAFIEALDCISKIPEEVIDKVLSEAYQALDIVGIDFNTQKRSALNLFLKNRAQQFDNYSQGLKLSRVIIELLDAGEIAKAKNHYASAKNQASISCEYLQREWLLENNVRPRKDYIQYIQLMPEILQGYARLLNSLKKTPLHIAVEWNEIELIHLLLKENHQALTAFDSNGNTPLHICAYWNFIDAYRVLIQHKANPLLKNNDNLSALDILRSSEKLNGWPRMIMPYLNMSIAEETSAGQSASAIDSSFEIQLRLNHIASIKESIATYSKRNEIEKLKSAAFHLQASAAELNGLRAKIALDKNQSIDALEYAYAAVTNRKAAKHIAQELSWHKEALEQIEHAQWPKRIAQDALDKIDL